MAVSAARRRVERIGSPPRWGRGRPTRPGADAGLYWRQVHCRPMALRITMLGSGTSTGVPVIGCTCAVCTSSHPRNCRWRPGLKLETAGGVVLIDTPTDLRAQALRFGLPRLDAVVYTHPHADHVFGLDEIR